MPATGKAVLKNKCRLKQDAPTPTIKKRKTFHDSPKLFLNESLKTQQKSLLDAANIDKLYEFINFLIGLSPVDNFASGEAA